MVSLKDARTAADRNRLLLSQGIDPLIKRDEDKAEAVRSRKDTLRSEAASYIRSHSTAWSDRHTRQWKQSLRDFVFPKIGSLPVGLVTTEHIVDVLQAIWLSKPVTAARVRNRLELILDASKAKGMRQGDNPARWRGHLDKLLPKQKVRPSPMAAFPYKQLPDFMRALDGLDGTPARALEAIILSGLRTGEVARARWDEFDWDNKVWIVPAERMKNRLSHRVPLSDALIEVLNQQRGLCETFVFPSSYRPGAPIALNAPWRVMRSFNSQYVPHGFRAAFRTWAGEETNFPREVCELCLSHNIAGKTEAAYSRGDMLERRREVMHLWSCYVRGIVEISSVDAA